MLQWRQQNLKGCCYEPSCICLRFRPCPFFFLLRPSLFLRFQVKGFRFLLALLALLVPTGSWAAWPGDCSLVTFSGSGPIVVTTGLLSTICDWSLDSQGRVQLVNCSNNGGNYWGPGTTFYRINYNFGGITSWYYEGGKWLTAGSVGTVYGDVWSTGSATFFGNNVTPNPPVSGGCPPPDPCQDPSGNPAGDCPPPDEPKPPPPDDRPKNFGPCN